MKEKSNIIDRISQIIYYKGFKNINDFSRNGLGYKSAEKINRLKKENNKPSYDILLDISNKIEEINLNWLITGEGEMLKAKKRNNFSNTPHALKEPQKEHMKIQTICIACDEKERVIQGLKSQLEEVRYRLADKDKQIEALENNLGMVIASKDEMLSMKEEAIKGKEAMLAAKDEIIRIQSKRISELESHHEVEDLKKILGTSERIGQESTSFADIHPKDVSTKAKKGEYKV